MPTPRIALIASRFRDGGVERWMRRLANGLVQCGQSCDLVIGETWESTESGFSADIWGPHDRQSLEEVLNRYLDYCDTPPILIPFRTTDFSVVLRISRRRHPRIPVFLATGTFIRDRLNGIPRTSVRRWKIHWRLRHQWPQATGVIAVSPEVAEDWKRTACFDTRRVHAPRPPAVGPDLLKAASEPLDHPWLAEDSPPVILGVGRLHWQKGFDRLISGFARLTKQRPARLILLGQGAELGRLRALASSQGVADVVDFPGFVDNPYNWMSRAAVVVAPSRTETFGFALVESLYVGTPFIADAAPPGPRSIQRATGFGDIIDTSDPDALAASLDRNLHHPPPSDQLHSGASVFDQEKSAAEYIDILSRYLKESEFR